MKLKYVRKRGDEKMKRKPEFVGLLVVATFLLVVLSPMMAWSAEGNEDDFEMFNLGEIVVEGSRSIASDIVIKDEVTIEDFKAINAESVADALTYVPGVQVTYGRKFFPSVSIHGFNENRILTMIDGVPYYETKYGGLDLNQVSLEAVGRIDVVKGAPSVLYGPNALGGVVNIITKKPTDRPYLSVSAEYGLDGVENGFKAAVSHGRKIGIYNYWVSYAHREWDSYDLSDDFEPREGMIMDRTVRPPSRRFVVIEDGDERANSDYKTDNFWAKVGIEPSEKTEIYMNLHLISTEKGASPDLDRVMIFSDFSHLARITAYDDWGIDLSAEHTFSDTFKLQGKLYYHDHEDEYTSYSDETYSNPYALSTYKDSILGGMVLGNIEVADSDTLRFSAHYKRDFHEQRDMATLPYAESIAYTGSIGLENEFHGLGDNLSILIGASYDWYDIKDAESDPYTDGNIIDSGTPDTSGEFNPMIGATYYVNDSMKVFASIARKTRFPTLSQIYSGEDPDTGSEAPNLALEAESSINYTVGVSGGNDAFKIEAAPYFHDISDYITRDLPPSENPFEQYKNYDKVQMYGVEINTEIAPYDDLLFKIAYVYNHARNKSSERVSNKVMNVPEYTFNVSGEYIVPGVGTKINLSMLYMGESYSVLPTPADPEAETEINGCYQLANAKITQSFMESSLEAFLSASNLFDEDYEPNSGQPAAGRKVWLGLSYKY